MFLEFNCKKTIFLKYGTKITLGALYVEFSYLNSEKTFKNSSTIYQL